MDYSEYEMMYRAEDHHWWYQGMRAVCRRLLDRHVVRAHAGREPPRILDAGCGTGLTLEYLKDYGPATGIDLSPAAIGFCRQRGLPRLARASILELPFADATFDLITSYDVISSCQRADAPQALREFLRVLRPGGHLLLRLPAYMWLHGHHDELVHTYHRFTRSETAGLLRDAGFAIERLTYVNCLLFPLAAAKRLKDRLLPSKQVQSDISVTGGAMNPLFQRILRMEARWVGRFGLPFGLTVIALARKPAA